VAVDAAELTMAPFVTSVQVLDIGAGGVLLESPREAQLGDRGRLTMSLAGEPFAAQIEVQRVSPASESRSGLFHVAAKFVALRPEDSQVINRCTAL
jgi:hypothetical protein